MRTFNQNNAIRLVGSPHSMAAAGYTNWQNMVGFRRLTFLVGVDDDLGGDVDVQAYEATSAAGANAQSLGNDYAGTFTAGDHDGFGGSVEVLADKLSSGYSYVGLHISPAAETVVTAFAVLSDPYSAPVSNTENDGIAFVAGSSAEVAS
jgi:hypothetical protein